MGEVSKDLRRLVGRTLEWFIVGQMARKVPPEERFFLLYEVLPGKKTPHAPRVQLARKHHGRGGFCIGNFTLVTITHAELARVVGSAAWVTERLERGSRLAPNEARCVVLRDDAAEEPQVLIFSARSGSRPSEAGERAEG